MKPKTLSRRIYIRTQKRGGQGLVFSLPAKFGGKKLALSFEGGFAVIRPAKSGKSIRPVVVGNVAYATFGRVWWNGWLRSEIKKPLHAAYVEKPDGSMTFDMRGIVHDVPPVLPPAPRYLAAGELLNAGVRKGAVAISLDGPLVRVQKAQKEEGKAR